MNTHASRLRPLLSWVAALAIFLPPTYADESPTQPCGNQNPNGGGGRPCPEDGGNPFSAYTGNAHRAAVDLEVFGSVGKMPLRFMRYANTRMAPQSASQGRFGREGVWTHSYQWFLRDGGAFSNGQPTLRVGFPDGRDVLYVRQPAPNAHLWLPAANVTSRIVQSDTLYSLETSGADRYHFIQRTSGSGGVIYRIESSEDSDGNLYTFGYNNLTDTLLRQVTDASGRWLKFTYINQGAFAQQSPVLATVPYASLAGTEQEVFVTNQTACRFLTLYGSGDHRDSDQLPVSELQFFDENNVLITGGAPFGSDPLFDPSQTPAAAFDGNPATYYRYAFKRNGYVGLDLGAGNAKKVSRIRYTIAAVPPVPPATAAPVLPTFQFVGLNETASANWVIKQVSAGMGGSASRTITYDYSIFQDQSTLFRWGVLDRVNYPDGVATYTYTQPADFSRPILATADDPRLDGNVTKVLYEFDPNTALGFIRKEKSGAPGGAVIAETAADGAHKPKVIYPGGRVKKYEYFLTNANLKTQTDALGKSKKMTWANDNSGHLASLEDERGHVTSYTSTALGNPLTVSHPDGRVDTYTRDARERVLTHTVTGPGLGPRLTTYTRHPVLGRIERIDHPDATYETFAYNAFGQVTEHRLRNGGLNRHTISPIGLRMEHRDPTDHFTAYLYDAREQVSTASLTVPGLGVQDTLYEYNDRGQVNKLTYEDNSSITMEYDAYGNQKARADELGHRWEMEYDEFKRMTSSTIPKRSPTDVLPRTTVFNYDDPPGGGCCGGGGGETGGGERLASITLPSGKTTAFGYDLAWRKTSETVGVGSPDAATKVFVYDDAGNMLKRSDGRLSPALNPYFWTYTYDSRNRMLTESDPLGNVVTLTYDPAGNRLTEARPHPGGPGVTMWEYDVMNRRTRETNANNEVTRYEYDGLNRVKKLIDARTHEYTFDYDLAGRKTRMTYPDTSFEQWTYNHAGQTATYRTRAGQTRTCGYDQRNRDLTCDWDDATPDIVKTYDDAGRMLTMNNGVSNLSFTYDDANQLLSETQDILPSSMGAKTVAYDYDADGNRASRTAPDGSLTGYTYTGRNQVLEITDGNPPPLARFSYDLSGRRLTKHLELDAAGVSVTNASYRYNAAGQLNQVWHRRTTGQLLTKLDYTISGFDGVQTSMDWAQPGVIWTDTATYDGILQLTGGSLSSPTAGPGAQHSYTYDEVGNRLTVNDPAAGPTTPTQREQTALPANNLNQYTQIQQTAPGGPVTLNFTHDTNGNLATGPAAWDQSGGAGSAASWTYTYDAQNRLTLAVSSATGVTVALTYDARNRCVSRTVNGAAAYILYDEWNVLEDRAADGTLVARYIHGPNVDEMLCKTTAGGTVYYHEDRLASIVALTNASGQIVERYAYTGFGQSEIRNVAGALLSDSGYGNRFRYTGREWVSALGLYDYRNRYYSLSVGRFLQTDPIRFSGGDQNIYRYVGNIPTMFFDPSGEYWHIVGGAVVGGLINGSISALNGGGFWGGFAAGAVQGGLAAATLNPSIALTGSALGGGALSGVFGSAGGSLTSAALGNAPSLGGAAQSAGISAVTGGLMGTVGGLGAVAPPGSQAANLSQVAALSMAVTETALGSIPGSLANQCPAAAPIDSDGDGTPDKDDPDDDNDGIPDVNDTTRTPNDH